MEDPLLSTNNQLTTPLPPSYSPLPPSSLSLHLFFLQHLHIGITMSVLELDSFSEHLSLDDRTVSTVSPNVSRKKRSSVWDHARTPTSSSELVKDGTTLVWYCKHCSIYSCKSTTTARNHLSKKHNIDLNEVKQTNVDFDKKQLKEAITQLVVRHDLPFRLVEWPAFQKVLKIANPAITKDTIITAHSSIVRSIDTLFVQGLDNLRKQLQSSLSKIHFAADVWTSPNRLLFLGISVQFVNQDRELVRTLIGLRPIFSHRGIDQV